VRIESFLSQARQLVRQEKLWVGVRGGFLNTFLRQKKVLNKKIF